MHGADLALALTLADAAREPALAFFRSPELASEDKAGAGSSFDPVTAADRAVEDAIRAIVRAERPDDAIRGEEEADETGTSGRTWVIDPIDGTRAFLAGLPTWGVLIALNDGAEPVVGVMDQPFTGERYYGISGSGGSYLHGETRRRLRTRPCAALGEAVLCSTDPGAFATEVDREAFLGLRRDAKLTRYGTDCYAYAMLALGQIDAVVESGLQPFDIQAMMPIVRAAGGTITGWDGGDCQEGGRVVATGDRRLHDALLGRLASAE